jgi:hypothetical protein
MGAYCGTCNMDRAAVLCPEPSQFQSTTFREHLITSGTTKVTNLAVIYYMYSHHYHHPSVKYGQNDGCLMDHGEAGWGTIDT